VNEDNNYRIFCVSDIHTDEEENWKIVNSWKAEDYNRNTDILIVAGDISDNMSVIEETFLVLKKIFSHIFYVPGNNELRIRKGEKYKNSIRKFEDIIKMCQKLDIHTHSAQINGVWIVPLFGWYSPDFDSDWDGDLKYQKKWLDFRRCKWPDEFDPLFWSCQILDISQ